MIFLSITKIQANSRSTSFNEFSKTMKNGFFANCKKYKFYKEKVCFLSYIMLAQGIKMKDKKINIVKNWLKLKSICNIQIVLGFLNFY